MFNIIPIIIGSIVFDTAEPHPSGEFWIIRSADTIVSHVALPDEIELV